MQTAAPTDRLRIDFLFLNLEACTRCRGTDEKLGTALAVVRDLLVWTGTDVEVNKVHVESAQQARELRFVSSPTIRVNGRDIAGELRESRCNSGACTDDSGAGIACRVWVHEGNEHGVPPVALIVDAILRAVDGEAVAEPEPGAERYELPENLERFFARKVALAQPRTQAAAAPDAGCCSPAEQRSCCEAEDKAACCRDATAEGCGCG